MSVPTFSFTVVFSVLVCCCQLKIATVVNLKPAINQSVVFI